MKWVVALAACALFVSSVEASAKKKPKRLLDQESNEFGGIDPGPMPTDDFTFGLHKDQEGEVDTPYRAEAGGATGLGMFSAKPEEGEKSTLMNFDMEGHVLFLLGRVGIGPDIGFHYDSATSKVKEEATGAEKDVRGRTVDAHLGPMLRFFFKNVDTSITTPFINAGLTLVHESTKVGDAKEVKATGGEFKLGGGYAAFLDSNIAFAPRLDYAYRIMSGKPEGSDKALKTTTSGVRVLLELMTFL